MIHRNGGSVEVEHFEIACSNTRTKRSSTTSRMRGSWRANETGGRVGIIKGERLRNSEEVVRVTGVIDVT